MFAATRLVNQHYTLSFIQAHMHSVFWQNSSFALTFCGSSTYRQSQPHNCRREQNKQGDGEPRIEGFWNRRWQIPPVLVEKNYFFFHQWIKLSPRRPRQVSFLDVEKERRGGERKKRAIKEILRSLMVFSGYTRLCGKATPPEALNLCGPGAGATENKQCLLVIRTSLRHTKSRAQIGFMFGPGWASNRPKCF